MSRYNQTHDFERDLGGSRKVYNLGGHQSSLLDNFDITASGGARRYDQIFDSQISHSVDQSQEFSQRQYDSNLLRTAGGIQRSETEIIKLQQVSFASHKQTHLHQMRTGNRLERIDEIGHSTYQQRSNSRKSQQRAGMNTSVNGMNLTNAENQANVLINSTKLEESVQAPDRQPVRIEGLTQFLKDEFYRFTGVYSVKKDTLFQFWKDHVSVVYRMCNIDNLNKSRTGGQNIFTGMNSTFGDKKAGTGRKSPSRKTMTQQEFDKENQTTQNAHNAKTIKRPPYSSYAKLYEFDVIYTLQQDLEEEENKFKAQQLERELEAKKIYEEDIRNKEIESIKWMVEEFYQDLSIYQIQELEAQHEIQKDEHQKSPTKNWHKQKTVTKDSLLESQASDIDKKEPKKPYVKEEFDKKVEQIQKSIEKEQNFIENLMIMVRDEGLTNDPTQIIRMYKEQKEKARLSIIWAKGDDDAARLIKEFFKPEKFLKRVTLYYNYRNKLKAVKHLSLFGFYLQLSCRERKIFLIDWKPIKKPKEKKKKGDNENPNNNTKDSEKKENIDQSFDRQLTYDSNKQYSVEEIIKEYETWIVGAERQSKQKTIKHMERKEKKQKDQLLEEVLGKERKEKFMKELEQRKGDKLLGIIAKPKDKWKRGRILLELKKKFPHDMVLQKMIEEEFRSNRVFKYPEEYDQYDDDEDQMCKVPPIPKDHRGLSKKDLGDGKTIRDKFKMLDDQELYYLKKKITEQRRLEKEFDQFLVDKVHSYLQMRRKRLSADEKKTVRQQVAEVYWEAVQKFPSIMKERFPLITYGNKFQPKKDQDGNIIIEKDNDMNTLKTEDLTNTQQKKKEEEYKKYYPLNFKRHLFQLIKSFVKVGKGHQRIKNAPPTFIIPSGRKCTLHAYDCPEGCQFVSLNKKVLLKASLMRKRYHKVPTAFRSRVWRRQDFKKKLDQVYLLQSEMSNCTFEPEAGSLSKTNHYTLKVYPNLARDGDLMREPDPEAYFKKLGTNFEKSHPEVYKAGVLKKSKLLYSQGKYEEALTKLNEGFNMLSIRKHFDPNYMKRFMAEELLKKKKERLQKEKEEEEKKATGPRRVMLQKETHDDVNKKKPEEDWENKKLIPILREAYDLITIIESKRNQAEKQIRQIEKTRRKLKQQVRGFSTYKKSQTKLDFSKGESALFKTIMCPLRDKCGRDQRPKWPTSNIKSITQFGRECPFAHHPMELRFPESLLTKLSSTKQTIKALQQKMDEEKPRQVFKPAGRLFDCVGCNSKSGKHMGGPCNLCRYKEMADESSKKFIDKKRKESLMRSMERRDTSEQKKEKQELKQIQEALDLDNNYTKKFGLLKKACILFFYGRYNDAFDEIAKAAEIVQKQMEVEQQKQKIIEKRWKFKLGLDDGFELPIPIEQIDPSKVDEKFLKKMDLQGTVNLSTLKLFIEQTSPQKTEEFSKHAFLNKLIEDYYLQFEAAIDDKLQTIQKMKKQVEKLDEEADLMDAMGTTGVGSSPSPEKGDHTSTFKMKTRKLKMCPHVLEKKKCPQQKDKKCPYAHNPIELDLIGPESKMKNLNGVIMSQSVKIKNMKPIEAWKPAKSGDIEHTHLMDMTSKKRKRGNDDEEDDEHEKKKETMKKSIYERENLKKKPYETGE